MSIEQAVEARIRELTAVYQFTDRLQRAESLDDVYEPALDAIINSLQCSQASILLRDRSGVMRFVASRGLSEAYQRAINGHWPWGPEVSNAEPICIDDVAHAAFPEPLKRALMEEGIHSLAFIPLQPAGRVIGKFMTYYNTPHTYTRAEIDLAVTIARQLGFGIERKCTQQALKASRDRLQLALDTAQIGWWQYDPLRGVAVGDARFKEIFDIPADELPNQEIKKLVHPADAERFWLEREADSNPASLRRPPHEYRVQRRDGEVRWVEVRWLPVADGGQPERGPAIIVGTVHDITERKQREEREHLLMREINHRAKNMLNVVEAVARQTATRAPGDFIERFSERIQALAAIQDQLIRNAWRGAEVEDLVRAQLAPFGNLIGSRIVLLGTKVRLNAASAQAIGLALHELATNAGKYGALSNDRGRVEIGWSTEGDIFKLSWTERGGPQVCAPQSRGFGTIVIHEMAERTLDGTVDLEYAPSGLTWRLTCPSGNALEP